MGTGLGHASDKSLGRPGSEARFEALASNSNLNAGERIFEFQYIRPRTTNDVISYWCE